MAVITTEGRNELTALYVAMFGVAPGSTSLSELVAAAESGKTLLQIATDLSAKAGFAANFPGFMTGQEFANALVADLLPSTTPAAALTWANAWVLSALNSGKSRAQVITEAVQALRATANTNYTDAKAQLSNKVDVSLYYAITKGAAPDSAAAIDEVTASAASVADEKNEIDTTVVPGAQFALTTGTDNLAGDTSNNTFNGTATTLTAGDKIEGGAGTDRLVLTATGSTPTFTLTSVETVDLTASPNPATVNLVGSTGITSINNLSSANGATLTVNNVGNVVNTTLTGSQAATTITYTTAAVAGTADASTLTLAGVSTGSSFTANGVETVTIASTTSANTLTSLNDTGLTKLVITGDKDLTITSAVGGATIATVDASAATGALKLSTGNGAGGASATGVTVMGGSGALDITTGTNKDTVTLGAGNNTVVTGAGNDTITSGAGTNTITSGAGNDTINLNGGKDTIRFDTAAGATNSDLINGFTANTVLSFNLGTAQTTTPAAAATGVFGTVQTGATSPTFAGVSGTGTGAAVVAQTVAAGTATANTIAQASNVVELEGSFTDGTANGVESALGVTGTTGVTTTSGSRFLLVTYSVGNIAQVWSYIGDTDADTNIDAAELSLVATLNNVPANSLTSANISTYLATTPSTTGPDAGVGQTIELSGTLNTVQTTANANGQFLTAANDTINVAVGTLPTAAATATSGLTIIDTSSADADVLNATVLGDWAAGSVISGIETINLNMLVPGTSFSAAAKTPGTKTFNLTGTQNFTVTALPDAATIGLGAGYTGTATASLISETGTTDVLNATLAGSVATSNTVGAALDTTAGGVIETSTVTVTANSSIRMVGAGLFGTQADVTAVNLAGSGNLTVFGLAADLDTLVLNGSGIGYTGALTLRPADTGSIDLTATGTGGVVTGVRTIDVSDVATYAGTITFAANNGTVAPTINFAPTLAAAGLLGAVTIVQAGSGLTDAVTLSLGANATGAGNIAAQTVETLTINSARASTATLALGDVTLANAVGTQKIVVTGASTITAGTFTADTIDFSGTSGTVTGLILANTAGATFQAGSGNTSVAGSGQADIINGGIGNDTITGLGGDDVINAGSGANSITGGTGADLLTGGAGVDTYVYLVADVGDTITNFATADIIDWNTAVSSTNAATTTPTVFQAAAAGTAIGATTTVFELTGVTGAAGAANFVTALGATATNADTDANMLFVYYLTGGGAEVYNWINADANVEASELTLVATLTGVVADSLVAANFI